MLNSNDIILNKLFFEDKVEEFLCWYFSKLSWRKFDILEALPSLSKTPHRSCFISEKTFNEIHFLDFFLQKNIFLRKKLLVAFSPQILGLKQKFFCARSSSKISTQILFYSFKNLLLCYISDMLRYLRSTRWKHFSLDIFVSIETSSRSLFTARCNLRQTNTDIRL